MGSHSYAKYDDFGLTQYQADFYRWIASFAGTSYAAQCMLRAHFPIETALAVLAGRK